MPPALPIYQVINQSSGTLQFSCLGLTLYQIMAIELFVCVCVCALLWFDNTKAERL